MINNNDIHNYDDIIDIERPKSMRPKMSLKDRGAQFAPFAALTGHKEAVIEKARVVDSKKILDEDKKTLLDNALAKIVSDIKNHPQVIITYYQEDNNKDGGSYLTTTGNVKKIDEYYHQIVFDDKTKVNIDDIYEIEIKNE